MYVCIYLCVAVCSCENTLEMSKNVKKWKSELIFI